MSTPQVDSPAPRQVPVPSLRLENRHVLLALGVLTPLGLFNTITIGDVPISLMWLAAAMGIWAGSMRLKGVHVLYLLLCLSLVAKVALGGSAGTAVKFLIGVVFLLSLSRTAYEDGLHFLKGLNALIPISLLYAAYQWAVLLVFQDSSLYGATLPIELWNSKGWHVVLPDPLGLPRASAFMFEPAYFAMFLDTALAGELLYRRGRIRYALVAQVILGLALANSRVGLFAALVIVASSWLARRQRVGLLRLLAVLAAIGPLLPLFFITDQLIDFTNNRDAIDISVFARYISFAAFLTEDVKAILFGVVNYQETFLTNNVFSAFSELLEGQGSNLDPKSFLAANLFQFGVVGSFAFYGAQIYLFRHSARALALLASINIIFFNVYAYSWPLYWIVTCLALVASRMDLVSGGVARQGQDASA